MIKVQLTTDEKKEIINSLKVLDETKKDNDVYRDAINDCNNSYIMYLTTLLQIHEENITGTEASNIEHKAVLILTTTFNYLKSLNENYTKICEYNRNKALYILLMINKVEPLYLQSRKNITQAESNHNKRHLEYIMYENSKIDYVNNYKRSTALEKIKAEIDAYKEYVQAYKHNISTECAYIEAYRTMVVFPQNPTT